MQVKAKDVEDVSDRTNGRPCACAKRLGVNTYKYSTATRGWGKGAEATSTAKARELALASPDACCGEDCLNRCARRALCW